MRENAQCRHQAEPSDSLFGRPSLIPPAGVGGRPVKAIQAFFNAVSSPRTPEAPDTTCTAEEAEPETPHVRYGRTAGWARVQGDSRLFKPPHHPLSPGEREASGTEEGHKGISC